MIPRGYIDEWKEQAPWSDDHQVEQDLIIERAIVDIFSDEFLRKSLAFRGGTALHKLFLKPQARYSEDIDLVQMKADKIGPTLIKLGEQLKFLGKKRKVKQNVNNNTIIYRFTSEVPPEITLRLKIEINCREHFTELGYKTIEHETKSSWYTGNCQIITYEIEESLGTKIRALYQRKKGRDLFDIWYALTEKKIDTEKVLQSYHTYMNFVVDNPPSREQYISNLKNKITDPEFYGDIHALLRPGIEYDINKAYELVVEKLISKI